jgi:hypothetical protein
MVVLTLLHIDARGVLTVHAKNTARPKTKQVLCRPSAHCATHLDCGCVGQHAPVYQQQYLTMEIHQLLEHSLPAANTAATCIRIHCAVRGFTNAAMANRWAIMSPVVDW